MNIILFVLAWGLIGAFSFFYWFHQDEDVALPMWEASTAATVAAFFGPGTYLIMRYIHAKPAHSGMFKRRWTRLK